MDALSRLRAKVVSVASVKGVAAVDKAKASHRVAAPGVGEKSPGADAALDAPQAPREAGSDAEFAAYVSEYTSQLTTHALASVGSQRRLVRRLDTYPLADPNRATRRGIVPRVTSETSPQVDIAPFSTTAVPIGTPWALPIPKSMAEEGQAHAVARIDALDGAPYRLAAWIAGVVFVSYQLAQILLGDQQPSTDEATSILSGLSVLQGHGATVGSSLWSVGAPLWPVLAAAAHSIGGIIGTRTVGLAFSSTALAMTVRATRNLLGDIAALWAAVALAFSGLWLEQAHLGSSIQLATAGVGVCLWAIARTVQLDNRRWLAVGGSAFGVAILADYSAALCALPLAALVLALRRGRFKGDLFVLALASLVVLIAAFLPLRPFLPKLTAPGGSVDQLFGSSPAAIATALVYYCAAPGLLGIAAWWVAREKRWLAAALFEGFALWPIYHLLGVTATSEQQHIQLGYVFGYPLTGALFAWLWAARDSGWEAVWIRVGRRAFVVIGALALSLGGYVQQLQIDAGRQDFGQVTTYLAGHVLPSDTMLIDVPGPAILGLYEQRRLGSLADLYDAGRIEQSQVDVCGMDWFIDASNGGWPEEVRSRILACGTYLQTFTADVRTTHVGPGWMPESSPSQVTIYVNVFRTRSA
jgi:hypothetical protein